MEAHFPPFNTVGAGSVIGDTRHNRAMQNAATEAPNSSGGPLPSLAEQLQRVGILRSRVGALAERLIGPRGGELRGELPTVYGGIIGALETENATLCSRIDGMFADLDAIEAALQ